MWARGEVVPSQMVNNERVYLMIIIADTYKAI